MDDDRLTLFSFDFPSSSHSHEVTHKVHLTYIQRREGTSEGWRRNEAEAIDGDQRSSHDLKWNECSITTCGTQSADTHRYTITKCVLFIYPQDNYVVAPVTCCTSPGETGRSKPCVFIGSLLLRRRCRTSGAGTLGDVWSCWGTLRRIFQLWAPDARRSWSAAHLQPVDSNQRSRCSWERFGFSAVLFQFSWSTGCVFFQWRQ